MYLQFTDSINMIKEFTATPFPSTTTCSLSSRSTSLHIHIDIDTCEKVHARRAIKRPTAKVMLNMCKYKLKKIGVCMVQCGLPIAMRHIWEEVHGI